jgi:hypothetical protein
MAGLPLLDFDLGARFLELLLDGRRLFLGHAFLHGLWRAIDEVLGFLQAEAGDFAHGLNDVDLARFVRRPGPLEGSGHAPRGPEKSHSRRTWEGVRRGPAQPARNKKATGRW